MATSAGAEFDTIFNWDGVGTSSGDYTDVTLEAQSPAGTSFTLFNSSAYYLYLGHASKFDMAIFDVDTAGSLGALTWQYYNGSAWTEFVPGSARLELDPDDDEGGQYDFSKDGAEIFPSNLLSDWATVAINSATKYWVRVTAASVSTAPTIKRIQMRSYQAYCTTKDVFQLLQLGNITGTTDFTSSTTPTLATVESYIMEAQARIDYVTRKSWRPNAVWNEYHEFNLNGFKLDRFPVYKVNELEIWSGGDWTSKTQGRKNDYFFVPDTGMIHFSRYFLLPARFTSYNAPVWRWGGGEFVNPIKVSYLYGGNIATDTREGAAVTDICKKMVAIDVLTTTDFGGLAVSGMDRVQMSDKISTYEREIENRLDSLKAFEVF